MRKKYFYLLFTAIICCVLAVFFYIKIRPSDNPIHNTCAFCDPQIVNRQKFYEDDLIMVLYAHKPIVPSHFLIIPKRHIERLEMLTEEEVSHIYRVINKVDRASAEVFQTSPYFIHQKNGREVGQSVPHVHFHFIAKCSGDISPLKFLIKMIKAYLCGPISSKEMQKAVEKMKLFMQSQEAPSHKPAF